ncbi:eukaryotic translation initiation factor 3 subunit K-like [Convolutriloba macropyga]|uniref:eukaryotic translation initiation factor 3 subunit K-like n=1 Tax=Convolutriloba macropyga TaxID=536237 RepID=UPI003F52603C
MSETDGNYEELKEQIEYLLEGIELYNPENAVQFEAYVDAQVAANKYDFKANLCLLKLYQFDPQKSNDQIILKILLKALMNLPHPDFLICKALMDKDLCERIPPHDLTGVFEIHFLLETCQFEDAWQRIDQMQHLICKIEGFDIAIRNYIGHVVASTFANVPRDTMCQHLGGISVTVLNQMAAAKKWQVTTNQVFFPGHEDNVKSKNIVEILNFEKVASALSSN